VTADHPGHGGLRLSMAHEDESGHRICSLLFVRIPDPIGVAALCSRGCAELIG
jgi:hypothetical protein